MSGVEEQYLRARIVPLEGFGPGREKERIGLAPGVPGSESAVRVARRSCEQPIVHVRFLPYQEMSEPVVRALFL